MVIVGAGCRLATGRNPAPCISATLPITLVTAACEGDRYDKPLLSVAMARQLDLLALVSETGRDAALRLGVTPAGHTHAVRICADTANCAPRGRAALRPSGVGPWCPGRFLLPPGCHASLCWRVNHLDAYQRLRQHLGDQPGTCSSSARA